MSMHYDSWLRWTSTRNALHALVDVSEWKLEGLRQYTPYFLGRGISSLPDDVLSYVFEVGYNEHDYNTTYQSWDRYGHLLDSRRFSIAVSSVSHRFRKVALDSPRMWCRLDNRMNADLLALFISRSRDARLHLHATTTARNLPMKEFLELAMTERSRWTTFSVWGSSSPGELSTLRQYLDLKLPRLTKLVYAIDYPSKPENMGNLNHFQDWDIPQLCHLGVKNGFLDVATTWIGLTACEMTLTVAWWDTCVTLQALESLLSLQTLSLKFGEFKTSKFVSEIAIQPILLPNLKNASLTFTECDARDFICKLMRGLHLTGLMELTVSMQFCGPREEEFEFHWLLPRRNQYPSLQNYVLQSIGCGNLNLASFAHRLPSLTHFSFEGHVHGVSQFSGLESIKSFQWHFVRFQNLCRLTEQDIAHFSEVLMGSPNFQRLEIINCENISEIFAKKLKSRMGKKLIAVSKYYRMLY